MPASSIAHKTSAGRYTVAKKDRMVPGGRAQINARLRTVQAVEAAVDDPYGQDRIRVTVNRRTDILEMERSHGRISEAAYRTGQTVQAIFQRLGYAGIGAANLGGAGGGDPVKAVSDKIERMLESAEKVRVMMDGIARQLGMIDTRLLRRILGDRMSFAECGAFEGKSGERGATYVANRFRDALEDLAAAWSARGSAAMPQVDKHMAATLSMVERQQDSIRAGVSEGRRKREAEQEGKRGRR